MLFSFFIIIMGFIAVIARKTLAKQSVSYQQEFFKIKLNPRMLKFAEIMFIFVGGIFIVLGLAGAFGVITFR